MTEMRRNLHTYTDPSRTLEVRIVKGVGEGVAGWRRTTQSIVQRLHVGYEGKPGSYWRRKILDLGDGEMLETAVDGVARQWRTVLESETPRESKHWIKYTEKGTP